jgi:chromosome segregation ATPase
MTPPTLKEPEVIANLRAYRDHKKRMKDYSLKIDVLELDGALRAYDTLAAERDVQAEKFEQARKLYLETLDRAVKAEAERDAALHQIKIAKACNDSQAELIERLTLEKRQMFDQLNDLRVKLAEAEKERNEIVAACRGTQMDAAGLRTLEELREKLGAAEKAMCDDATQFGGSIAPWHTSNEAERDSWRNSARTVLTALHAARGEPNVPQ